MKGHYVNFKKGFTVFHILSGVLALICIFLYIQNGKYPWVYKSFLLSYIISGAVILIIFFRRLSPLQKTYFELLFLAPFLLIAFELFIKAFDYLLFG